MGTSCAPPPPRLGSVLLRRSLVDFSFFSMVAWAGGAVRARVDTDREPERREGRARSQSAARQLRQRGGRMHPLSRTAGRRRTHNSSRAG